MPVLNEFTVLDEMARRLRSVCMYDNKLADQVSRLVTRHEKLLAKKYPQRELGPVKPLRSWDDAKKMLVPITNCRRTTFTEIPAATEVCLNLAVWFYRWEMSNIPHPTKIRFLAIGEGLVVEWSDTSLIVTSGGTSGNIPDPTKVPHSA